VTRAPENLMAVRRLLLNHLNTDPDRVRTDDLESAEVGIVGDAAHRGGYHCGSNRVINNDYSVVESSRDRDGLTDFASALDVGMFRVQSAGRTHTLFTFSVWLVEQCRAGTADTRDIREVIYSPDGRIVRRWDRLGRRTSGDSSHLWHTHISFFRDSTKAGRDLTPVFRRYLIHIGLIESEDVLNAEQARMLEDIHRFIRTTGWADTFRAHATLTGIDAVYTIPGEKVARVEQNATARKVDALAAEVAAIRETLSVPPGTVTISDEQFERVLRKVIGSVDNGGVE
jgi:hypothetical protein